MSNITDLFDTGVDSSGNILGDDVADPHYTLTSFPSGTVPPAVTVPAGYPFGVWIANTTTSKWIGPNTTSANGPVGSYTYETTFTLPTSFSTASITGEWATDDEGVNILLNGNSIGITNNKLFQLTSFTISNSSDFKAGTNTLDFVVKNDGGPTGLEVDNLVGNYSPGIANPTPIAKSDSYSLSENTTLTVPLATGVLANDSDPNGNPLTAVLVNKPSDGTVSFNPNGSFSYTPTTDFVGTDTFTYEDNNGNANSSPATVSVQVGLNLFDTGVDSAGNVLGDGVVDPHYTLTSFPSGAVPPATTVVNQYYGWLPNTTTSRWIGPDTSGANGPSGDYTFETTFTIPSGLSIASITGTWITDDNGVDILINGHSTKNTTVYDTATNFSISSGFVVGTNTLDFIVDNGPQNVGLQVENLVVNYSSIIANPTPIAKSDSYSLSKNTTLTVPLATGVLANDSDPNGNPLTAVLVSKPSDGTVSFNPDGSFTYTPTTDFVGTDTFTYEDNDGNSNSSPATVSLKISNVGVQTSLNTQTPGVATLSYTNVGLTSVAAPLFQIVTTNAQINSSYQNSSPTLAELLGLVIGLGGNNQPGLLPAGTLLQEYVPYTSQGDGPINLSVQPVSPDTVIDWTAIKTQLYSSPSYSFINSQAWNAIWTNFTNSVGNTYGSLQTALDADVTYLSSIGTPVTDISQLLQFELAKASNSLANTTIASTNDAFEAAPGLSLTFNRTFYNSLVDKDQVGSLGVGWSSEWDTHFSTDTNGNVTIYEDGGQRLFTKQSDGTYQSQTGDYGQLTLKQGQYVLQESDGTLYAFRSDNQRLDYVQDTNGNRITAGYTGALLTSLVQSNGESLTLSYNSQSDLSSITDSAGQTTTYSYDPSGQYLLSVTTPQGTTSYTYSNSSNPAIQNSLLSITNPDGTTESFSYNNQGLLAQQSGSGGVGQVSYTYNQGEVQATDALGNTSSVLTNTVSQASQIQNPLGNTLQAGYDSNNNLTSLTAPGGTTSSYQYDSKGNLISYTDPLGNHLTLTYTPTFNELQSLTDQKGNTTGYSYDANGNLTGITYANGTSESYSYNSQGDVTQSINQNGSATNYTYNSQGLLLSAQYADGTSASYTYDQYGDLTSATNASGTELMTYNSANLLSSIIYSNGQSLSYSYNAGGQLTSMVDQSGFTTNYSYNAAGELAGTTDAQGNSIATYTYDADGNLIKQVNGNGTYTTYQYDQAGQVTQLTNYAADNSINSSFNYTYNSLGEQTSEATLDGTWTYQYNALAELTNAVFASTNSSVASQNLTYIYDAAGNRIQTIENGTTTNYATNNVNQYTTVGTTTEQYDANGNLISQTQGGVTTTYTYNAQNRLTGMSDTSGNTWSYTYDALGNRISSTYNGQQTNYLVNPTGLGNVVGQYDSSGKLISDYTYGLGLTSQVSGGTANYYDFNSQGSTVGLTGANGGSYLDSYTYSPFGENLSSTGTVNNPFQYVGEYGVSDEDNGLYSMGAREYDPTTGRFTQQDSLGLNGGDTNLYRYALDNPTSFIDPSGHEDDLAQALQNTFNRQTLLNYLNNAGAVVGIGGTLLGIFFAPVELIGFAAVGSVLALGNLALTGDIKNYLSGLLLNIVGSKLFPPTFSTPVTFYQSLKNIHQLLYGDTHLTTLDGTHYNFQGAGEFTLVKSTTDDFEIQVRQQPWNGSTTVTVATAVSLELGGQRIGIYLNDPNPLKINGTAVNLSDGGIYAVGTDIITRTGNSYNILSANNDLIQVSLDGSYMGIGLALAANRQGKVVGLLGNDNGTTSDDFALRNGTVLGSSISNQELYGDYANSWRITQATSLFDYATGQNTNTFTDLNFPPTVTTLNTLDPQAVATAKQIAQNAGITDPTLLQDATYDLASTNNNTD
jgi:RHS repeat-associated protein